MQYQYIIFIILSIIGVILGVWLVIALIPITIDNIEQINQKIRVIRLQTRITKIHKLQQTEEYQVKDDNTKQEIEQTLQLIESDMASINKTSITQNDIELSLSLQNSISSMIDYHVDAFVHDNYAINNIRYDIMQINVDVKKISGKVFSSLNPDIFKSNLIYTEDYLMTYIVEYTKTKLLSVVIPYNADFTNY